MFRSSERGAVTAEAAFASLGLVWLLAVLVSAIGLVLQQVECVDAAAAIARQYARDDATGVAEARTHVPRGGRVVVTISATRVTVRVDLAAAILPGSVMAMDLSAESTAVLESGATG